MEKTRNLKDLVNNSELLAKTMRNNVAGFLEQSCHMEHTCTTWTLNGYFEPYELSALRAQVFTTTQRRGKHGAYVYV